MEHSVTTTVDVYEGSLRVSNVTSGDSATFDEPPEECDLSLYPSHWVIIRHLWIFLGYPILVLGTVGHVLVVSIVLSRRGIRNLSLSIFLVTMSLSGLMALYVGLLNTIVEQQSCHHIQFKSRTTETGCQLLSAAVYFSLHVYSWMEACIAVERLTAVRWPTRYRQLFTPRHNAIAVWVIVTLLLVLNSMPYLSYGYNDQVFCDVVDRNLFESWRYVHGIVYAILPVSIMLPSNAVVLHALCSTEFKMSASVQKAKPLTLMMFVLNVIFFLTVVPFAVGDFKNLESSTHEVVEVIWTCCRLLMYLGSSATFLVYASVFAKFRKALKDLLLSGKAGLERALSVVSGGAYQPRAKQYNRTGSQHSRSAAMSSSENTLEEKL